MRSQRRTVLHRTAVDVGVAAVGAVAVRGVVGCQRLVEQGWPVFAGAVLVGVIAALAAGSVVGLLELRPPR